MADEIDIFDLSQYPEDQHERIAPLIEQAKAAQEAAARFEGIDLPDDELKSAIAHYQAYTDPHRSEAYRESMARKWGTLPEGMTLAELTDLAQQVAAYNEAQMNAEPEYNEIDPAEYYRQLEERLLGRVDERLTKHQRDEQERWAEELANREVAEINAQEQQLYSELRKQGRELEDWEREQLEARIALRLQREEYTTENAHTFVRDTWEDFDRHIGERAAALLKAQREAPRTGNSGEGATPGTKTVVTDLKTAEKHLAEMIEAHRNSES